MNFSDKDGNPLKIYNCSRVLKGIALSVKTHLVEAQTDLDEDNFRKMHVEGTMTINNA